MRDLHECAEKLEALLFEKGAGLFEYQLSESEKKELNTEKDDFNLYRTIFNNGVSVTVIMDGKKGAASGSDLSDTGLAKAVEDAILGAASAIPDEANVIAEKQEPEIFRSGCLEADMPRLYEDAKAFLESVKKDYPLVNIFQAIADHDKVHTLYANSSGTRFENYDGVYHFMVEMSGSDGDKNTGIDFTGISILDLDTPLIEQGAIARHLRDVEASLNSVSIPDKFEGTVIFTPECLGEFLQMTASNYIMSNVVMEGTSQWLDKLGQQVMSDKVTISLKAKDDRLAETQPYTRDGYKAEDVTPIENGVLKHFLLSLYAAKKTGRPVTKNTDFAIVMEKGDVSLADMIASVEKGLIVGGFSGGNPGANGEFSGVAKNSFYIENGKIKGAVTETMINGTLEKYSGM